MNPAIRAAWRRLYVAWAGILALLTIHAWPRPVLRVEHVRLVDGKGEQRAEIELVFHGDWGEDEFPTDIRLLLQARDESWCSLHVSEDRAEIRLGGTELVPARMNMWSAYGGVDVGKGSLHVRAVTHDDWKEIPPGDALSARILAGDSRSSLRLRSGDEVRTRSSWYP